MLRDGVDRQNIPLDGVTDTVFWLPVSETLQKKTSTPVDTWTNDRATHTQTWGLKN